MQDIEYYFDYAAATPMLPEVVDAMRPFFIDNFYNPSALYLAARANKQALEDARQAISQGLGARPTEIVFTAGGTEANNLAIDGVMKQFPDGHIVSSTIEHESILQPVKAYNNTAVGVDSNGFVDTKVLEASINDNTVIVSIMYVNNEVGAIQPIANIAEIINRTRRARKDARNNRPIYLHTDACQAVNYLDMQINRLGVDLLTMNAGKIYGPKQCGALYIKTGVRIAPIICGGGQEWKMRSGTENLANIVGFTKALQKAQTNHKSEAIRLSDLRDDCINRIEKLIPKVVINGPKGSRRLANNIHLTIPGYDNERLLMELDERGLIVATGSACSASNDEPSHVLSAMGLSDGLARNSLRITLGRYTSQASIDKLVDSLVKIVALS